MPKPCLIAGHDLWREIYNDAADPVSLLCDRLGCQMVSVPNEPGDDLEELREPSSLRGWWVVDWSTSATPNKFNEAADYEQFAVDDIELYRPLTLLETIGPYSVYQGFRHWRVIRSGDSFLLFREFPTEQAAREFCLKHGS